MKPEPLGARDAGMSGPLIDAAGLVADGSDLDLLSLSSSLDSDEDRAIADELAAVALIAQAHRKLHQVLPPPAPGSDTVPFAASWGHLDLIEVVGRGSYGTVYRAWDPRLDRQVALKLFHGARNPEAVMREGRMLARIRHENVVIVYGADVYNGIAGIWMEFVHGRRLDQIVEQSGPLSVEDTTRVGVAVCRALVAVHGAGLLHCDVKAQNVIREQGGRIVLMDLGAGREAMADEDGTSKQVAGTPRYMAPEVFDRGSAKPQSDVYSVGVLLFYLATGKFPVDGKTLTDMRRAHLEARRARITDYRPDLPAAFVDHVMRALDPTPEKRHDTPGAFEAGLENVSVAPPPAPTRVRLPWKWMASAAALVAIVAALVAWLGNNPPAPAPAQPTVSVAVLPIKNLTGDPAKAYLADGLTEVLISNLARVRSLRVPSFEAVKGYRDAQPAAASNADDLNVDLLLAGSLSEIGPQARITVHLIDRKLDRVVWGEELTREPAQLMSAQTEIARLVVAHLRVRLGRDEELGLQQRSIDPEAQDAYLRGLAAMQNSPTLPLATTAVEHFRRAVTIDPQFAGAWGELANAEIRRINYMPAVDRAAAATTPREEAERAIQLDPTLAAGYVALGTVQFHFDWDYAAAERTFRTALTLAPSATPAQHQLSMLLAALRRTDEAIAVAREAQQREPLVPAATMRLGTAYYYARKYDAAEAEGRRLVDLAPRSGVGHYLIARTLSARGRHDDAIAAMHRSLAIARPPGYLVEYARILTAAGRDGEVKPVMDELAQLEGKGEGYSLDNLAYIAAASGRTDEAFEILGKAFDRRLVNMLWLPVDPRVDPIRSDPRFATLLSRMGLQ